MQATLSGKNIRRDKTEYTGVHPQKFALWIGMASMFMFFAALTSGLLIKKGDFRVWQSFPIPKIFLYNTFVIAGVSICMHLALISYRKAQFGRFRAMLLTSFLLAILFLAMQLFGLSVLKKMGLPLTGNQAGSFIYLFAYTHGAHIIGGLVVTLVFIIYAFRARKDPIYELRNIINPKRQLNLELLVTYWHFIDAVWVYIYIFCLLNYQ
jgi:cytochrome c oxidase subunit 3